MTALAPAALGPIEKTPLERYVAPAKPSLVGLTRGSLGEALAAIGVPEERQRMRVQQLWHWIYRRGVQGFEKMTTLSKELRAELEAHFTLARPEVAVEQVSVDGTRKWLLRLPSETPGERPHEVECVYIPESGRGTLCVSSQVGCTLNCSFCHTGTQRLVRNRLVPLNRKYPIAQLLDACRRYPGLSNARRITFEYVMLKGVNDSLAEARALVKLLKGIPAKINLIPFNPWPGTRHQCSDWEQIEKFSEIIFNSGYASPGRTPRGRDILAACGPLKSASEKLSARERLALRAMAMTD